MVISIFIDCILTKTVILKKAIYLLPVKTQQYPIKFKSAMMATKTMFAELTRHYILNRMALLYSILMTNEKNKRRGAMPLSL